jgi:hypothetical protein
LYKNRICALILYLVQARQTRIVRLPKVALLERLQHVLSETLDDEPDALLPEWQPALEEPHDDDVVGEGDCVVVELEGVGVGQRHREHGQVLVEVERAEYLWQLVRSEVM